MKERRKSFPACPAFTLRAHALSDFYPVPSLPRYFPPNDRKLQEIMILVENHLQGCAAVPPEVRASLDYLSHRSAVQRADLPPHWKSVFFRGVWARLHPDGGGGASASRGAPGPDSARDGAAPNTRSGGMRLRGSSSSSSSAPTPAVGAGGGAGLLSSIDALDKAAALEEMRPMIEAAALWLGERDAEEQARREWRRRSAAAGDGD